MVKKIGFTKMHGAGNDYIYVDISRYDIPDPASAAIQWSKWHTGIGSDGLVLIDTVDNTEADFSMRIFNADGTEAMMCGNASRCIGKYLYERGLTKKDKIKLQTKSGVRTLLLDIRHEEVSSVSVDMGEPHQSMPSQYNPALANGLSGTFISMGNPHYIIFTDDIHSIDIERIGKGLEYHEAFPQRCNIEFAQIISKDRIRTRVWERGSGITMACGTGACATAVAAVLTGRAERKSDIIMDGGTLCVEWKEEDGHVYLSGPAAFVYDGEVSLPDNDS